MGQGSGSLTGFRPSRAANAAPGRLSALKTGSDYIVQVKVKSAASGLYSTRLPLIPWYVEVQSILWNDFIQDYEIVFRIHYLYLGSNTMAIGDGISVISPLSGI